MIALDSSALVAIAISEPDGDLYLECIKRRECLVGAPTLVECHLAVRNKKAPSGLEILKSVMTLPQVGIIAFKAPHYRLACETFDRFGKGRGHPAQLNFGDCLSYAVAKYHDVALLYKGNDFVHTDLHSALP